VRTCARWGAIANLGKESKAILVRPVDWLLTG